MGRLLGWRLPGYGYGYRVFREIHFLNTKPSLRERIYDCAALADSFITSPNWPVRINFPLPSRSDVSTLRSAPPTSVHARPVATPVSLLFSAKSSLYLISPKNSVSRFFVDYDFTGCFFPGTIRSLFFRYFSGNFAAYGGDFSLQVSHPRFPRVVFDHNTKRLFR